MDSGLGAALSIAATSLLTEDLAVAGAAGLWASGRLAWGPAFWGAYVGIGCGDMALYALGRLAGGSLAHRDWPGVGRFRNFCGRAGVGRPAFVALARVIPGARLGGYTASGFLKAPMVPFTVAVLMSAFAWVLLWFALAGSLGSRLGCAPLCCLLATCLVAAHWVATGFQGREWRLRLIDLQRLRWAEFWPAWFFYAPVLAYAATLGVRMRGLLLPTLSNPGIENGGLINESKDAIFRLLPAHEAVLAWSVHGPGDRPKGGAFPLIAKPDAGQRGSGVRLIRSQEELDDYAAQADFRFLTQEYCPAPKEAGVFYVRRPGESAGRIFSITEKLFPQAVGDGRRTLAELILADPRDRNMARVLFKRHGSRLEEVLPAGTVVRLVESGNHSQGAVFLDGHHLLGEGLSREIDGIARAMPGFFVGRFDLRYEEDEAFSRGRGFKIVEVNGASAEATHIYDPSLSVAEVYRTLFEQWRMVFEIGADNRRLGLTPCSWGDLLRAVRAYRASSRRHPLAS